MISEIIAIIVVLLKKPLNLLFRTFISHLFIIL